MIELIKEYFSNLDVYHIGSIILVLISIINNLIWFFLRSKSKTEGKYFLKKVAFYKRIALNIIIFILKLVDVFIPNIKIQKLIIRLRAIRDKVLVNGVVEKKDEAEGNQAIKDLEASDKVENSTKKVQMGG